MNFQDITALEYLEAEDKAARDGAEKPPFKHIQKELRARPKIQERLAFELLRLAWRALEEGDDAGPAALAAISMRMSIDKQMLPEYLQSIEKIAVRCFDLMKHGQDSRFTLTLTGSLVTLRSLDNVRFDNLLKPLKQACGEAETDSRRRILALAEELDSETWAGLRQINKVIRLQQLENDRRAGQSSN